MRQAKQTSPAGPRTTGRRERNLGDDLEPVAGPTGGEAASAGLGAGGEVGQAASATAFQLRRPGRAVVADTKLNGAVAGGGLDGALPGDAVPQHVGNRL